MANQDIRLYARGSGVPFWKIAQRLSISEPTMTRRLRAELSEADKKELRDIINELKEA